MSAYGCITRDEIAAVAGLLCAQPGAVAERAYAQATTINGEYENPLTLVRIAVEEGRAARPELHLGICGEHGGDPAAQGSGRWRDQRVRQPTPGASGGTATAPTGSAAVPVAQLAMMTGSIFWADSTTESFVGSMTAWAACAGSTRTAPAIIAATAR